jgi:hypothetical protein
MGWVRRGLDTQLDGAPDKTTGSRYQALPPIHMSLLRRTEE